MKVDTFDVGASDRWASWNPGEGSARAEEVGNLLGSTAAARERVREAVLVFDGRMPLDSAMCLLGALWVPDADSGEPWAFLLVDLLVSTDPSDPVTAADYLFMVSEPPHARGLKVFDYSAAAADVAAGPAVVQVEVSATKRARDVTSAVTWTVFPPNCHEAVRLSFSTPASALSEALAEETTTMAHALSITLTDAE